MNLGQVARMLAGFASFFTLAQLPPFAMALLETNTTSTSAVGGFVASMLLGALVAALLHHAGRNSREQFYRKEAIAIAGLGWVLASVLGAIPFQWSGLLPDPIDAVFETVSGLTTTGATVLGCSATPPVADTPPSLLLWRSLLQWIGGIGIILVFVALLPAMGITGKNLLTTEAVGVSTDTYQVRAIEKARLIGSIYVGLTIACGLLLVAIGGFGWFDAVCHAFTAMATGGFSTRSSIREFDSLGGEIVLTVFMFVAGTSFAFLAAHWRNGWRALPELLRSGELRMYAASTAIVIGACTLALVRSDVPLDLALRQAAFNGVSVLTSTGYASADFQAWPTMAVFVLMLAMLVGGCSGSTAGGFKQVRLLVILKLIGYTIRHFMRPKIIERIKLDDEVLPAMVISSILAIVLMWLLTIAAGTFLISLDERMTFVGALTASTTMVCNCGPAMTMVEPQQAADVLLGTGAATTLAGTPNIGPLGGFGDLHGWTKVVMIVQMLLGRLELLTVFALLSPSFWRR